MNDQGPSVVELLTVASLFFGASGFTLCSGSQGSCPFNFMIVQKIIYGGTLGHVNCEEFPLGNFHLVMAHVSRDRVIKMLYSSDVSSSRNQPRREREEFGRFNVKILGKE